MIAGKSLGSPLPSLTVPSGRSSSSIEMLTSLSFMFCSATADQGEAKIATEVSGRKVPFLESSWRCTRLVLLESGSNRATLGSLLGSI